MPEPAEWMRHVPAGMFDRRILHQDTHWVTGEGTILAVGSMSTEHLTAVLALLRDAHATYLHHRAVIDAVQAFIDVAETGRPQGEQTLRALIAASIATAEPEAWLESTRLVRTIQSQLATRRA